MKWARFETIVDLDCYLHLTEFLFWCKVEPHGFSCHACIGFLVLDIINLIGLLIPLWLSTGDSLTH